VLVRDAGAVRVDANATFMAQYRAGKDDQPLKKYCHSFEDRPMSGKIAGVDVTFRLMNREQVDFGMHKADSGEISVEPCPDANCFSQKTPTIRASKLDYAGDGGNFTNTENITLFTPPKHNSLVTDGSYRITERGNGKRRLEISFNHNADNHINGYLDF